MEAAGGISTARAGVSLPMSSSSSRTESWRVVSDHHSVPNAGAEDSEHSKLERSNNGGTIYKGRERVDIDFGSITLDGSLDNDILQRLRGVERQREELQQMEVELRAQLIARSEIVEMQNSYEAQIKEHANAAANLRDQLRERDQTISAMGRKIDAKDRELHDIKLINEAAWAKEDLLREQNKELATFRREHDNSEAERARHLKQIHDFQVHMEEKERQFIELQEQNRIAQETILYKDEQLRDAQAWISRAQEMDALHSTANQSLQAELRERTEQYNHLWLGSQRHFVEMETLHIHTVQQLQHELADVRERSGTYTDESGAVKSNSKDVPQIQWNNEREMDVNAGGTQKETFGALSNENANNISSLDSDGNAFTQIDHVPRVAITPSSILGNPTYIPPGQVASMHPFVMHQQGVHSIPAFSPLQYWQNQQGVSEASLGSTCNQYPPSQPQQNILILDSGYDANGKSLPPENLNVQATQEGPDSLITMTSEEAQVSQSSSDKNYVLSSQSQQSSQKNSSQLQEAFSLDSHKDTNETKENSGIATANLGLEPTEQPTPASNTSTTDLLNQPEKFTETNVNNVSNAVLPEVFVPTVQTNAVTMGKTSETSLLDESSLLSCIVRTIPAGSSGRIRISSTLPNRLGKMLAPLHWHDYKKKYGKLDDFVAGHPELFVIEGDYIQIKEGAQEIIAATAAVAKVAAAATASSPYSSLLPSVAVTPMAQSHRLKTVPSINSKPVKSDKAISKEDAVTTPSNATDNVLHLSTVQDQHSNAFSANVSGSFSNVKILSKPKDGLELSGTETRSGQSSVPVTVRSRINPDTLILGNSQNKGSTANGRPENFPGKHQGRTTGLSQTSRR